MRGVLWCNGSIPSEDVINSVIVPGVPIFGVDGGADGASGLGIEVQEALGDLDSVDTSTWGGKSVHLPEQNTSDLAKSLNLLIGRGFDEIDIVGADGGDPSHILGNWASMNDVSAGATIRIHHEEHVTTRIHPDDGEFSCGFGIGEEFSIFALEPCRVWISGAKWNLNGVSLGLSTKGLHNEGLGGVVSIKGEGILVIISRR